MSIKERIEELKADIPAVYIALKDKSTPPIAKVIAIITVGYALSPVDLIPDFVPILGYLDDVIILPSLVALTIKLIPDEIWMRSKKCADGMWENGKPKKWYYAIPILIIWGMIIWLVVKTIWL